MLKHVCGWVSVLALYPIIRTGMGTGLNVRRVINEPTAAALAYGTDISSLPSLDPRYNATMSVRAVMSSIFTDIISMGRLG